MHVTKVLESLFNWDSPKCKLSDFMVNGSENGFLWPKLSGWSCVETNQSKKIDQNWRLSESIYSLIVKSISCLVELPFKKKALFFFLGSCLVWRRIYQIAMFSFWAPPKTFICEVNALHSSPKGIAFFCKRRSNIKNVISESFLYIYGCRNCTPKRGRKRWNYWRQSPLERMTPQTFLHFSRFYLLIFI